MRPPLTLREFARRTGFAPSTVSMALRDDVRIGSTTRERIQTAAARLGFRVHPLVAAVHQPSRRRARAHLPLPLAFLTDVPAEFEPAPPSFFGDNDFTSIQELAPGLGFRPEVFRLAAWSNLPAFERMLLARGFVAAILGPCLRPDRVRMLDWSRLAVVSTQPASEPWPFHQVRKDPARALNLALEHLLLRPGRIGVALCRHNPEHPDDRARRGVFLLHAHEHPDRFTAPFEGGHIDTEGFLAWVRAARPDTVLGFEGHHLHVLRAAGRRIPGDLGYAQLHVRPEVDGAGTAGVENLDARLAAHAVRVVDRLLRTGALGLPEEREDTLLHPRWFEGATLPAAGGPARVRPRARG